MSALDFPTSPSVNDTYAGNGKLWRWDGTTWISATGSAQAADIVDSGTSRTLSTGDNISILHFTSGSAITLNMAGSLGAFQCVVLQEGAGQITFAANGQTMTVAGSLTKTAGAGAMATIISRASGTFFISGTLA